MADHVSSLIVRLIDQVTGPARNVAGSLRQLQGRINTAITANKAALASMRGQLMDAVAAGYALKTAIEAPIKAAVDFETLMEDIGQKTNLSGGALRGLGRDIQQLARQTNTSTTDMGKAMDFLLGMGLGGKTDADNIKAALGLAPIAAKAAVAYRASTEDMAKTAHAAFQNMKVPLSQMESTFDSLSYTAKQGGFEFRDMAQHMPSLTAMAQSLGITGRKGVADLGAALQVARKGAGDASEAANNLLNVLQKIESPTTRKNFKKVGIDISKEIAQGLKKGVSPMETLALATQKAMKKGAKLSDLFEDRQAQLGLLAIIQNIEEYRRIRAEAIAASGMVEEDFQRRIQTSQGAILRFKAAIENLNISIGTALLPGFTDLLNVLARLAGYVERFAEANPKLARTVVMVASGLIALRVAAIGAGYAALFLKGGFLMAASGALGVVRAIGGLVRALLIAPVVNTAVAAFGALRTALIGFAATAAIAGQGTAWRMLGMSLLGLLNPMNLVRAAMIALKWAVIGTGIGAVVAGIAAAGLFIYNNWQGVKELFAGIGDGFMKGLGPARAYIEPVAEYAGKLWNAINGLLGPLQATNAEWRSWGETIGGYVAQGVNAVADGLGRIVGFAQSAYDAIMKIPSALSSLNPFGGGGGAPVNNNPRVGGGRSAAPPAPVSGARAAGGPVTGGSSYLVGERGPEIFTPGRSGHITPNHQLGSRTVTINSPITVNSPNADPRAVAREVARELGRLAGGTSHGSYEDAAYA